MRPPLAHFTGLLYSFNNIKGGNMAKVLVGAVALFAVALIYPARSQARTKYQATMVGTSLDPSLAGSQDGSDIDCKTITDCQAVPDDPEQGAHNPAVVFEVLQAGNVHIESEIWLDVNDCPGFPDFDVVGDLARAKGLSRIRIFFTPPLDDGTVLSINWALNQCPVTACQNYVLGTPPPDICPI